jgi:hypothetical protein
MDLNPLQAIQAKFYLVFKGTPMNFSIVLATSSFTIGSGAVGITQHSMCSTTSFDEVMKRHNNKSFVLLYHTNTFFFKKVMPFYWANFE